MTEDSIFITNDEQEKDSQKLVYISFFMYIRFGYEKKNPKFTSNATLNAAEKSFKFVDRLVLTFVINILKTKKM